MTDRKLLIGHLEKAWRWLGQAEMLKLGKNSAAILLDRATDKLHSI